MASSRGRSVCRSASSVAAARIPKSSCPSPFFPPQGTGDHASPRERDGLFVGRVAGIGQQHLLAFADQGQHGEGDALLGAAGDQGFGVRVPTDTRPGLLALDDPFAEPALPEGVERFGLADSGAGSLQNRLRGVGVGIAPAEAYDSVETRGQFHQRIAGIVLAGLGQHGARMRLGQHGARTRLCRPSPQQQRRGALRGRGGADRDRLFQTPQPAKEPGRRPEEAHPERRELGQAVERTDEHRVFPNSGEPNSGEKGRFRVVPAEQPVPAVHNFHRRAGACFLRCGDPRDRAFANAGLQTGLASQRLARFIHHRKQIEHRAGGAHSGVPMGRRGQDHSGGGVTALRPRPGERDKERLLPPGGNDHGASGRRSGGLDPLGDRLSQFRKTRARRVVRLPAEQRGPERGGVLRSKCRPGVGEGSPLAQRVRPVGNRNGTEMAHPLVACG